MAQSAGIILISVAFQMATKKKEKQMIRSRKESERRRDRRVRVGP